MRVLSAKAWFLSTTRSGQCMCRPDLIKSFSLRAGARAVTHLPGSPTDSHIRLHRSMASSSSRARSDLKSTSTKNLKNSVFCSTTYNFFPKERSMRYADQNASRSVSGTWSCPPFMRTCVGLSPGPRFHRSIIVKIKRPFSLTSTEEIIKG